MKLAVAVYVRDRPAGELEKLETGGFLFRYHPSYLVEPGARAVSLTLPLRADPYRADQLFPFFYGLLAEGAAKDLQCRTFKIDPDDAFTRLIKTGHSDKIGAVTVHEIPDVEIAAS